MDIQLFFVPENLIALNLLPAINEVDAITSLNLSGYFIEGDYYHKEDRNIHMWNGENNNDTCP